MRDNILFDLDGTLVDSGPGICYSVQIALQACGIQETSTKALQRFVGPPLRVSFKEFYHLNPQQIEQVIHAYREDYAKTGIYKSSLYPGVKTLLDALKKAGKGIYLATSKPLTMAQWLLDYFNISSYFDFVGGATLDNTRDTKAAVIDYVLENTNIQPNTCLMIGDRSYDVTGSAQYHIPCIGVLYGYGTATELNEAGAIALAKDTSDLENILLHATF